MADQFNVTAAWSKASYVAGETIKGTIAGTNTHTVDTVLQGGPVDIPVVSASGATATVTLPSVSVTSTTTTTEAVLIDTTRPIVDTGSPSRTWVVSADRKSITAGA